MLTEENILQWAKEQKAKEPKLTAKEREEGWLNIVRQIRLGKRHIGHHVLRIGQMAAMAILLVGIGGVINYLYRQSQDQTPQIAVGQLKHVTLYIEGRQIEFDDRAEMRCLNGEHILEVGLTGHSIRIPCKEGERWLMAVPHSQQAKVTLADGTEIRLRGGSTLCPTRKSTGRGVTLTGEALFRVAHCPDTPFTAYTGQLAIRVLGTEFLVQAQPDAPRQSVSLMKGSVEVTPKGHATLRIRPGQTLTYSPLNGQSTLSKTNIEEQLIWTEELMQLDGMSLIDLLPKIETHYGVQLSYDITALQDIHLEGKLDLSVPIETLLQRLSHIVAIRIEKRSREYIITKL